MSVTRLNDFYHFDDKRYAMMLPGNGRGNQFRIGDEITIRVVKVNIEERIIDFEVSSAPEAA